MRASPVAEGQHFLFEELRPAPTPRPSVPELPEEAIGCPPDSSWRWAVASWPHARWSAWLGRTEELLGPGAGAVEILAAQWRAYRELSHEARRVPRPD